MIEFALSSVLIIHLFVRLIKKSILGLVPGNRSTTYNQSKPTTKKSQVAGYNRTKMSINHEIIYFFHEIGFNFLNKHMRICDIIYHAGERDT